MITPFGLAETLLWGVANGCVYILLATGLNIIFGVMKLVNFAHGQLLMVGAFVAYEATNIAGLNPYASILVSMGSVALIGIVLEKFAFRKVRGTEKLNEIFVSLGLIYAFQSVATLFWGEELQHPDSKSSRRSQSLARRSNNRVRQNSRHGYRDHNTHRIGFAYWKNQDWIGNESNQPKKRCINVNGHKHQSSIPFHFCGWCSVGWAAGALYGILFPFNPTIGALPTIKAFAIIILGGLGSIPGAIIGGLLYGIAENVAVYLLGGIWQDAIAFALLIAVLAIRPTGLFGERGE